VGDSVKVGGIGDGTFRKFSALKTAKDRFIVTPVAQAKARARYRAKLRALPKS
jgi:hypothetical protein